MSASSEVRPIVGPAGRASWWTPSRALWVVALVYAAAQLLFVGVNRPPSWDEAIYLSQVSPDVPALPFVASRARGIVVLVAPLAATGLPLAVIRATLIVASAVAVAGSFRVWIRSIGWGAPAGAALVCSSWLALFYGAEVIPNLWAAVLGVAAAGFAVRAAGAGTTVGRRRSLAGVAITLGIMAVVRPPDALVLAAVLALSLAMRRRDARLALAIAGGVAVGSAVWLVEVAIRSGGIGAAVRAATDASHAGAGSVLDRLAQHVALTDGPTLGPVPTSVPLHGIAWWLALSLLALVALRSRPRPGGVVVATLCAAALVAEYLIVVGGLAPRFLLPGLAMLGVAAGAGAVVVGRRIGAIASGTGRVVLAAACIAGAAALVVGNTLVVVRVADGAIAGRAVEERAGLAVRELADGRPCALVTTSSFPQLAWASGCRTRPVRPGEDPLGWLAERATAGDRAFVVVRDGDRPPAGPHPATVDPGGVSPEGWTIYAS